MSTEGLLRAPIEDKKQILKKLGTEVREEKKQGVEFPGNNKVNTAIETQQEMVYKIQTPGCLPCQNGTVKNQ
jgi:hypothetical protein